MRSRFNTSAVSLGPTWAPAFVDLAATEPKQNASMVLGSISPGPSAHPSAAEGTKHKFTGTEPGAAAAFATHADRETLRSMVSSSIFRQRSPEAGTALWASMDCRGMDWRSLDVRLVRYKSGEFDTGLEALILPMATLVAVALVDRRRHSLASTVSIHSMYTPRDAAVSLGLLPRPPRSPSTSTRPSGVCANIVTV